MPDEEVWATFFQPDMILDRLGLRNLSGDVVEFGCGYGTFTIPAARRTAGIVHALDIEPEMVELVEAKTKAAGVANIQTSLRDFVVEGTGLRDDIAGYAMLFNILHAVESSAMLAEAMRVLRPGGLLSLIHWNYDEWTPRGPTMDIRPRPEQCRDMVIRVGFDLLPPGIIDLPPYHYGMGFTKPAAQS